MLPITDENWKAEPITKDGDGTKEKPLYYDWHSKDELTAENLLKLVPQARQDEVKKLLKEGKPLSEEQSVIYVVLVIHEDNKTLNAAYSCGLRLTLVKAEEPPKQEGAATGSTVSGNALTGQDQQGIVLLTDPEGGNNILSLIHI